MATNLKGPFFHSIGAVFEIQTRKITNLYLHCLLGLPNKIWDGMQYLGQFILKKYFVCGKFMFYWVAFLLFLF
jgi:hypothetical protein